MATVKRFFIALMGGTVVLVGIALLVLPGPGIVIILAGLAILASEFLWARRAMQHCKSALTEARKGKWFHWPWQRRTPPVSRRRASQYEVPPVT
jgi:uncharacterized protein (TIGR02611 family)